MQRNQIARRLAAIPHPVNNVLLNKRDGIGIMHTCIVIHGVSIIVKMILFLNAFPCEHHNSTTG